jgi:Family of unknown function (DUF6368)
LFWGDAVGPTLMVLIPNIVSATDASAIDDLLRRTVHMTTYSGERGQDQRSFAGVRWEFIPNIDKRGEPCGCLCTLTVVPFGTEAGCPQLDTAFIDEARAKLPFLPKMTLQLDNFCRSDGPGHRVLARVATDLAELFGGLIDVDGADYVLPAVHALGGNKPGQIIGRYASQYYALQYDIDETRTGTTYCIDAKLMRAWSDHPAFWLMV